MSSNDEFAQGVGATGHRFASESAPPRHRGTGDRPHIADVDQPEAVFQQDAIIALA